MSRRRRLFLWAGLLIVAAAIAQTAVFVVSPWQPAWLTQLQPGMSSHDFFATMGLPDQPVNWGWAIGGGVYQCYKKDGYEVSVRWGWKGASAIVEQATATPTQETPVARLRRWFRV